MLKAMAIGAISLVLALYVWAKFLAPTPELALDHLPYEDTDRTLVGGHLFDAYCAQCHQPEALRKDMLAQDMVAVVMQGGGDMPAFADEMTPSEAVETLAWIKSQWSADDIAAHNALTDAAK